jgi:hypothetical protein
MRGFGRCEGSLLVDAVNGNHLTRRRNPVNLAAVDQAIAPGVLADCAESLRHVPNRVGAALKGERAGGERGGYGHKSERASQVHG